MCYYSLTVVPLPRAIAIAPWTCADQQPLVSPPPATPASSPTTNHRSDQTRPQPDQTAPCRPPRCGARQLSAGCVPPRLCARRRRGCSTGHWRRSRRNNGLGRQRSRGLGGRWRRCQRRMILSRRYSCCRRRAELAGLCCADMEMDDSCSQRICSRRTRSCTISSRRWVILCFN